MPLRTQGEPFGLCPSQPRRRGHYRAQGRADAPDAHNQQMVVWSTDLFQHIRVHQRMKRVIGKAFRSSDVELLNCRKVARRFEKSLKSEIMRIGRMSVGLKFARLAATLALQQRVRNTVRKEFSRVSTFCTCVGEPALKFARKQQCANQPVTRVVAAKQP